MNRMEQYLADSSAQRESQLDSKRKELRMFEQKCMDLMDQQAAARKEQERTLLTTVEDRMEGVRAEIVREANARAEQIDELKGSLEVPSESEGRTTSPNCRRT